jgi:tellurite resistance protein TehA-like permease
MAMGMQISTEGTIGIALGLVGLAGAGAIMVFPQDIEIGWCLIAVAVIGFIWLAIAHFGLWLGCGRDSTPQARNRSQSLILGGAVY